VVLLGKDGANVAKSIEFNIGATLALIVMSVPMIWLVLICWYISRRFCFISLIIWTIGYFDIYVRLDCMVLSWPKKKKDCMVLYIFNSIDYMLINIYQFQIMYVFNDWKLMIMLWEQLIQWNCPTRRRTKLSTHQPIFHYLIIFCRIFYVRE